ncbi:hypothetical protein K1719_021786 [Acacia pycnantha]|nr:hypothetical protein K1719_021786 [Acacia pycnantha]
MTVLKRYVLRLFISIKYITANVHMLLERYWPCGSRLRGFMKDREEYPCECKQGNREERLQEPDQRISKKDVTKEDECF